MFHDMRGVMVRYPFVASPEMGLAEAAVYMKECDIRHLPIIENNKVVGLISERDLLRHKDSVNYPRMRICDVLTKPPFVISENESLTTVLNIMIKNKYGSALVTNSKEQLIGIFTTTDALILLENVLNGGPKLKKPPGELIRLGDVVSGWN